MNSASPTRPSELVRIEARALLELALRLDGPMLAPFERAIDLLLGAATASRPVTLTGIGKSGLIARKIVATLCSTGTPAHFLHPAEALHGDLGLLAPSDLVVALSSSGETPELLALLPSLQRLHCTLIAVCGAPSSSLAQFATVTLDASVSGEACPLNLAPTASTTVLLALGDALAIELSQRRGFARQDFADLHPGGRLGRRLTRVRDLMHSGLALPSVAPTTPMLDVIHEMSHKKLGMTTVVSTDSGAQDLASETWEGASQTPHVGPRQLLGMISDGDLRRLLERDGPHALAHTAADIMNPHPVTIEPDAFAPQALVLMESRKITSLIVATPSNEVLGVVHLHDLWPATHP